MTTRIDGDGGCCSSGQIEVAAEKWCVASGSAEEGESAQRKRQRKVAAEGLRPV